MDNHLSENNLPWFNITYDDNTLEGMRQEKQEEEDRKAQLIEECGIRVFKSKGRKTLSKNELRETVDRALTDAINKYENECKRFRTIPQMIRVQPEWKNKYLDHLAAEVYGLYIVLKSLE